MARIELQNVVKTYGEQHAVKNLDMVIDDGELLVLLGPSGCGKTTTMNMIAGLTDVSSGRILFDGTDVTTLQPHERNIAMVFQSSMLYPHMSARRNIFMSLKRSGLSNAEIEKRIDQAAATVNVTHLLEKLPSQLSGGERQRVATAKAIVREPRCFLLDEPLSALDAALRLTLRAELVNLQKRFRTTMIFVTHDQVEAMTMGDRIGVMRDGALQQIGTPVEIYNRPANLFVAGFVGTPPMNFLEGAIVEEGGKRLFRRGALRLPLEGEAARAAPRDRATLAIRPHMMHVGAAGPEALPVTVYAVEHLGNETVVVADNEDHGRVRLTAGAAFSASVGEVLHAAFDTSHALVFDPETGLPVDTGAKDAA